MKGSAVALLTLVACSMAASAMAGTHKEGLAWLEANKQKEGVITLASGLQYKVCRRVVLVQVTLHCTCMWPSAEKDRG